MCRLRLHHLYALVAVLILSGCGSLRVRPKMPSPADVSVSSSIERGDIIGLIRAHRSYPGKARSIEEFLTAHLNDRLPYATLKKYRQAAEGDEKMETFFQGLLEDRQEFALEYISQCSYEEMGAYCRAHPSEMEFLRGPLEAAVYPELDRGDYTLIRHLHRAFANTDLSPRIDKLWAQKRALILPEADKAIKDYFVKEAQLVTYYRERTLNEIKNYVDSRFPSMMETCVEEVENGVLDLIFVKFKKSNVPPYAARVAAIVNVYLPDSQIQERLQKGALSLVMDVHKYRRDLAMSLTMDKNLSLSPITINAASINYVGPPIPLQIPQMIESMVESTRKKQNFSSIASTIISFIPGGGGIKAFKAAVDGADLLYGISSSVKEKNEVIRFIQSYSSMLYETEMNSIESQFYRLFDQLKSFIERTRTTYVNEVRESL